MKTLRKKNDITIFGETPVKSSRANPTAPIPAKPPGWGPGEGVQWKAMERDARMKENYHARPWDKYLASNAGAPVRRTGLGRAANTADHAAGGRYDPLSGTYGPAARGHPTSPAALAARRGDSTSPLQRKSPHGRFDPINQVWIEPPSPAAMQRESNAGRDFELSTNPSPTRLASFVQTGGGRRSRGGDLGGLAARRGTF